jgi:DNA-binding response OmpR family regulator
VKDKILLVDDDPNLTKVVCLALTEAGYEVHIAANGVDGLHELYQWRPDLVMLDVMMPRMDGWETCRRIRELSAVPIVMLTAKSALPDEVKGLNIGADLYITKPFVIEVLIARIEALLRRSRLAMEQPRRQNIVCGELVIDEAKHEVVLAGRSIDLSPTEFKLLAALAQRAGEVVTHRELLAQVWGPEYVGEDLYLKLYIRYLRQKIEANPSNPTYILTRRGVGYCLSDSNGRAASNQ